MDIQYLLWWQELRQAMGGALDWLVLAVSELGEEMVPMALAFGLYWCVNRRKGEFLLFSFTLGAFFNGILKLVCCVYRPWIRDARITPVEGALSGATGYSFPSGHSTNAAAAYGGLGCLYRRRRWLLGCMLALVALIMLSRNYLGVHTPQDVLVGAALGFLMIWLTRGLLGWAGGERRGESRRLALAAAATVICALSMVYITLKPYPADMVNGVLLVEPAKMQYDHFSASGALLGFLWGWVWERGSIRFEADGSVPVRMLRYLAGMAVTLLLYTVVRKGLISLLGGGYGRLAGAFLSTLYATAVHPLLFTRMEKRLRKDRSAAQA